MVRDVEIFIFLRPFFFNFSVIFRSKHLDISDKGCNFALAFRRKGAGKKPFGAGEAAWRV